VCARAAGLANGGLFSRVMANSPGGILPIVTQGRPPVFVSAGVQDTLFPIGQGGDSVSDCGAPYRHIMQVVHAVTANTAGSVARVSRS